MLCPLLDEGDGNEEQNYHLAMVDRDKKRFLAADVNGDEVLDKDEFQSFIHPEEADHMKHLVVEVKICAQT